MGQADGNISYSPPRDRADAWRMRRAWFSVAGLDAASIVTAYQTHGAGVAVAAAADAGTGAAPDSGLLGEFDAIVTAEPGVVPMTVHADCMPVLLCDTQRRVVATVHAGWRGTVAGVVEATVRTMTARFGSDPGDLVAFIGPALRACCCEVGDDVRQALRNAGRLADGVIEPWGERWRLDLAAANRRQLEELGVAKNRIEDPGICSRCDPSEWFSHRRQGPHAGRYGAFIALESGA
jgi:YfiH family protein